MCSGIGGIVPCKMQQRCRGSSRRCTVVDSKHHVSWKQDISGCKQCHSDCVELFECECGDVEQEFDLEDPELNELEECGGGYLSDDSDDDDCGFTIDGEGDKKIIS